MSLVNTTLDLIDRVLKSAVREKNRLPNLYSLPRMVYPFTNVVMSLLFPLIGTGRD